MFARYPCNGAIIASFGDKATEDLYHGRSTRRVRQFPVDVITAALRKLDMVQAAHRVQDLRSPPGNQLEALKGELAGYFSIRVNQQWRLIFPWDGNAAYDVSLVDYH